MQAEKCVGDILRLPTEWKYHLCFPYVWTCEQKLSVVKTSTFLAEQKHRLCLLADQAPRGTQYMPLRLHTEPRPRVGGCGFPKRRGSVLFIVFPSNSFPDLPIGFCRSAVCPRPRTRGGLITPRFILVEEKALVLVVLWVGAHQMLRWGEVPTGGS